MKKSTDELISFGFSDRSVRSVVSACDSPRTKRKTTPVFCSSLVSVRI